MIVDRIFVILEKGVLGICDLCILAPLVNNNFYVVENTMVMLCVVQLLLSIISNVNIE